MISSTAQIGEGWDVITADDRKLGEVSDVALNYVVVRKGILVPTTLFVPLTAIDTVDPDRGEVYLNVAESEVDSLGWEHEPGDATLAAADRASAADPDDDLADVATAPFIQGAGRSDDWSGDRPGRA